MIADTPAIFRIMGMESYSSSSLERRRCDLHIHVEHAYRPFSQVYVMGAMYMSLVSLFLKRRPREDVIIFGAVGNAGSLSSNYELDRTYITVCKNRGYRRVIIGRGTVVPAEVQAYAEMLLSDGQPAVRLITMNRVLDAVPVYFS